MPSSTSASNVNRPVRQAALAGQAQRIQSDKYHRQLDKKFQRDMGTSTDEKTKAGKPRQEYYGR